MLGQNISVPLLKRCTSTYDADAGYVSCAGARQVMCAHSHLPCGVECSEAHELEMVGVAVAARGSAPQLKV